MSKPFNKVETIDPFFSEVANRIVEIDQEVFHRPIELCHLKDTRLKWISFNSYKEVPAPKVDPWVNGMMYSAKN